MTLKETKDFMERIKLHYQEFIIDNPKVEEWHKQLKDYNSLEVNEKFEEHLKSEQYGNQIPKIGFLTKYLIKEKEKNKCDACNIKVVCNLCGKSMPLNEYDNHIARCNSIEYLNIQSQRLYGRELNKEKLRSMDNLEFNKFYDKILNDILKTSEDEEEKQRIMNYFIGVE